MVIMIDSSIFLDRKETALMLGVKIHTLEIWKNTKVYDILHVNFFKARGKCFYKLDNVEKHYKMWDLPGYEHYTKNDRARIHALAKENSLRKR